MNSTIDKVRRYRESLADIQDIDIRVQELEERIIGINGIEIGERTGKLIRLPQVWSNKQPLRWKSIYHNDFGKGISSEIFVVK